MIFFLKFDQKYVSFKTFGSKIVIFFRDQTFTAYESY